MVPPYSVNADIAAATTLDPRFYVDDAAFALARDRVFARTWQWMGALADIAARGSLVPRDLLPGLLDEPLLLSRDLEGELRCLSNVCTHRANLLVGKPCVGREIRCGYHSRRFDLSGRMTFMPEFDGVVDFPSPRDNLPQLPLAHWAGQAFTSLQPAAPFVSFIDELAARLSFLPLDTYVHDATADRDFTVNAHWALYVENYLESFHIPFVHAGLNAVVDYGSLTDHCFRHATLAVAQARPGEVAFAHHAGAEVDKPVAAYYGWVFPNLMFNCYPWGLSLNIVLPQAPDRTRVLFRSFVGNPGLREQGAGSALDAVEMEDEAIVEAVQRGVRSRLYHGGRYSPRREQGVHHFHKLLTAFMADPAAR